MSDTIDVHLTLTRDNPNTINFEDTHSGLGDVWYKSEVDAKGDVSLFANADGFEHLARYFLKMARTGKRHGFDAHHTLEFGKLPEGSELTITFVTQPQLFPSLPTARHLIVSIIGVSTRTPRRLLIAVCCLPASLGLYWQCSASVR
jgi:hypothetical protein